MQIYTNLCKYTNYLYEKYKIKCINQDSYRGLCIIIKTMSMSSFRYPQALIPVAAEDAQQHEEEVDEVKIQRQ